MNPAPFVFPTDYDQARNLVARFYVIAREQVEVRHLGTDRLTAEFKITPATAEPITRTLTRADFLAAGF